MTLASLHHPFSNRFGNGKKSFLSNKFFVEFIQGEKIKNSGKWKKEMDRRRILPLFGNRFGKN